MSLVFIFIRLFDGLTLLEKIKQQKQMEQILNPLHLACRADDFSPNARLIEIKNGIATATNGHIVARVDLRENRYYFLT